MRMNKFITIFLILVLSKTVFSEAEDVNLRCTLLKNWGENFKEFSFNKEDPPLIKYKYQKSINTLSDLTNDPSLIFYKCSKDEDNLNCINEYKFRSESGEGVLVKNIKIDRKDLNLLVEEYTEDILNGLRNRRKKSSSWKNGICEIMVNQF